MNDEEQKKLCADLNQEAHKHLGSQTAVTCANAATEIERLAAENKKLRRTLEAK